MTNITARSIATVAVVMSAAMVNGMQVHAQPHLHFTVPMCSQCHSVSSSRRSLLHLQRGSCSSLAPSLIVEGTE